MDTLPPEILHLILGYVVKKAQRCACIDGLCSCWFAHLCVSCQNYACVSTSWQMAAETYTFSSLSVDGWELTKFADAFSGAGEYRRSMLRKLKLDISLPKSNETRDQTINQWALNSALGSLMKTLCAWECDRTQGSDAPLAVVVKMAPRYIEQARPAGNYRLQANLPTIQRVTSLGIKSWPGAPFSPQAYTTLARAFPRIRRFHISYCNPARTSHGPQREFRAELNDFMAGLPSQLPLLETLYIKNQSNDGTNYNVVPPDYTAGGIDGLCTSLRRLGQMTLLRELTIIRLEVSADLFRDLTRGRNEQLHFPALRRLDVRVALASPAGRCYYTDDPSGELLEPDSDSDAEPDGAGAEGTQEGSVEGEEEEPGTWRKLPVTGLVDPLVADFTDAVLRRMPCLQWARLVLHPNLTPGITIQCCEVGEAFVTPPDKEPETSKKDLAVRRWKVWINWRTCWEVPKKVEDLWTEWVGTTGTVETMTWKLKLKRKDGRSEE